MFADGEVQQFISMKAIISITEQLNDKFGKR